MSKMGSYFRRVRRYFGRIRFNISADHRMRAISEKIEIDERQIRAIERKWPGLNLLLIDAGRKLLDGKVPNPKQVPRLRDALTLIGSGKILWLPAEKRVPAETFLKLTVAGTAVDAEHLKALGLDSTDAGALSRLIKLP